MKRWQMALVAVVLLLVSTGGYLLMELRAIEVETLSDDLYVLRGLGGNTAVLKTDAGAVVVDTMTLPLQGERIRELARELTGQETVMIINTHYHLDHTHGNPAFEPGTRVLSTERTLSHLNALDQGFWLDDAAALLPNETFTDRHTLSIGGKTLELVHPGPGHTDGDLVVVFTDENTIHMGDLHFNGHYPNIDLEAGGTVQAWPLTLQNIMALEFDRVIPGHGPTTDRDGVQAFNAFITQLAQVGRDAVTNEWTLEQTLVNATLDTDTGYVPIRFIISLGLDREFVITRAWEEATGNFERLN
jgi:glyoxylase-like metal-dependent hydrolase (beta-lactamase superfamily II)